MKELETLFCTYDQALALKELGYDEPCFGRFMKESNDLLIAHTEKYFMSGTDRKEFFTLAPLKSQVFKWFREEHGIWVTFEYDDCDCVEANVCWYVGKCFRYGIGPLFLTDELNDFETYEEAEEACIDKLIELIKNK